MKKNWIMRALRFVVLMAFATSVFSLAFMGLWNWLTPPLFERRAIDFRQALGLLVLSWILFGGFHWQPTHRMSWWRRMIERLEQMSPEQREKFRTGLRRIAVG